MNDGAPLALFLAPAIMFAVLGVELFRPGADVSEVDVPDRAEETIQQQAIEVNEVKPMGSVTQAFREAGFEVKIEPTSTADEYKLTVVPMGTPGTPGGDVTASSPSP
jgi:hypothetical protein